MCAGSTTPTCSSATPSSAWRRTSGPCSRAACADALGIRIRSVPARPARRAAPAGRVERHRRGVSERPMPSRCCSASRRRRTPEALAVVDETSRAHLSRARRAFGPPGCRPSRPGGRSAVRASRCSIATLAGPITAMLGVAEGGRRIPAGRPVLSPRSHRSICSRTAAPARVLDARRRRATDPESPPPRRTSPASRSAASGLRDLHVRLDRETEGGAGRAPRGRQLPDGVRAPVQPRPADRLLQFASPSFDQSVEEIFAPLLHGSHRGSGRSEAMISHNRGVHRCLRAVWHHRTRAAAAYWNELALGLAEGAVLPASVRLVAFGGRRLHGRLWPLAERRARTARLLNGYGPTEATVGATNFEPTADADQGEIPIGRPIANVADLRARRPDAGRCRAAWRASCSSAAPASLAATSVGPSSPRSGSCPIRSAPGAVYRTGDLVRLPGGRTARVPRAGRPQVKVRGFRIELGEIEAVLRRAPGRPRGRGRGARGQRRTDKRLVRLRRSRAGARRPRGTLRSLLASSSRSTWCRPPSWPSTRCR